MAPPSGRARVVAPSPAEAESRPVAINLDPRRFEASAFAPGSHFAPSASSGPRVQIFPGGFWEPAAAEHPWTTSSQPCPRAGAASLPAACRRLPNVSVSISVKAEAKFWRHPTAHSPRHLDDPKLWGLHRCLQNSMSGASCGPRSGASGDAFRGLSGGLHHNPTVQRGHSHAEAQHCESDRKGHADKKTRGLAG